MSDLTDDMRKAADNPASILPPQMRDALRREADAIDESERRWHQMAQYTGRKGQPVTFEYTANTTETGMDSCRPSPESEDA